MPTDKRKTTTKKTVTAAPTRKGTTSRKATTSGRTTRTRRRATHEQIAERAYMIHVTHGGSDFDNWLQAERELLAK